MPVTTIMYHFGFSKGSCEKIRDFRLYRTGTSKKREERAACFFFLIILGFFNRPKKIHSRVAIMGDWREYITHWQMLAATIFICDVSKISLWVINYVSTIISNWNYKKITLKNFNRKHFFDLKCYTKLLFCLKPLKLFLRHKKVKFRFGKL